MQALTLVHLLKTSRRTFVELRNIISGVFATTSLYIIPLVLHLLSHILATPQLFAIHLYLALLLFCLCVILTFPISANSAWPIFFFFFFSLQPSFVSFAIVSSILKLQNNDMFFCVCMCVSVQDYPSNERRKTN